ncbi:glucosyltransferase [Arachnomyces sp. PD_36]|nr:glucosyltransferase [Arachnomyces sp. PD_36]
MDLRSSSAVTLFNILPFRVWKLLSHIRDGEGEPLLAVAENASADGILATWDSALTVLNICLFPPLFFFSGLYYTDLPALFLVLEAYINDIARSRTRGNGGSGDGGSDASAVSGDSSRQPYLAGLVWWRYARFVVAGLLALLCRQTNIFWVAVFLGGVQVVRTLHQINNVDRGSASTVQDIVTRSWGHHQIYDPPVSEACIEENDVLSVDYWKTSISLAISTLAGLPRIVQAIGPYVFFLATFGIFVLWNEGVVLGHKEFHTAGLHLPQMLYIWPYFLFFSWPIAVSPALNAILPRSFIPKFLQKDVFPSKTGTPLPRLAVATGFILIMLVTVHLNTIVHPFTLADNRHYVFYVFKLLLRHPAIKYLVTPIYFISGWAVLGTFSSSPTRSPTNTCSPESETHPLETKPDSTHKPNLPQPRKKATTTTTTTTTINPPSSPSPSSRSSRSSPRSSPTFQTQVRVSFILVWLISTALSLITAPLVEPRYFIIPWVVWRLHIPVTTTTSPSETEPKQQDKGNRDLTFFLKHLSPLILETIWLVTINAVTGYVFLFKGFEWPQEPGKVQRFLW